MGPREHVCGWSVLWLLGGVFLRWSGQCGLPCLTSWGELQLLSKQRDQSLQEHRDTPSPLKFRLQGVTSERLACVPVL